MKETNAGSESGHDREEKRAGSDPRRVEENDPQARIIDAALQVFASEGFELATLRAITERAGVNIAAVNYYFRSKGDLLRYVLWIGNLMLVILNLPLIGIWVRLLTVPYNVLFPAIIVLSSIGTFMINGNVFDLIGISFFGALGYVLIKLECEPTPFLIGFILGPMLEEEFRRAMMISGGDPTVFLTEPISAALLGLAVLMILLVVVPSIAKKRNEVFVED